MTTDGRLDEADWQGAPATAGIFQPQPEQSKTPTNDTRIHVLFDNIGAF